jgi:hypothetical protein
MLTQAFASTVLVDLQGKPWQPSSFPTFVITACCPFSEPLDDAANLSLHRSLQRRLQKLPGVSMEEIIGQSPDGSWKEPSWAVSGISEQQAIDLGRLYYQWAIFRFDEEGRSILGCWKEEYGTGCECIGTR